MVEVDDDFARFGSKSYAINKITSVEIRQSDGEPSGCAVFLILVTAVLALFAMFSLPTGLVFPGIPAALIGWWGYHLYKKTKRIEYKLFLITTASEAQAYSTFDEGEVLELRSKIESAMVRSK